MSELRMPGWDKVQEVAKILEISTPEAAELLFEAFDDLEAHEAAADLHAVRRRAEAAGRAP